MRIERFLGWSKGFLVGLFFNSPANPASLSSTGEVLRLIAHLLLMLLEHTLGESLKDPLVVESLIRRQSLQRVPLEALADQINEGRVG